MTNDSRRPSKDGVSEDSGSRRMSGLNTQASRRNTIYVGAGGRRMSRNSMWTGMLGGKLQKNIQLENTYRLEAKPDERFKVKEIEDLLEDVLSKSLSGTAYEAKSASTLTVNLANVIRKRLRETTNTQRFKFVVLVHIGSPKDCSISIASRAVWFPDAGDNFAESTFSNGLIFCVATVHAFYHD